MLMAFKLTVPADRRFQTVVADVTVRCVELAGGSASDGRAFADLVATAIQGVAPDATSDVELAFVPGRGGIEVTATCHGRSSVIRHALPVAPH